MGDLYPEPARDPERPPGPDGWPTGMPPVADDGSFARYAPPPAPADHGPADTETYLYREPGAYPGNLGGGPVHVAPETQTTSPDDSAVPDAEPVLRSFAPYARQLYALDGELMAGAAPDQLPGYMGSGSVSKANAMSYVYETSDGNQLEIPRLATSDGQDGSVRLTELPTEEFLEAQVDPLLKVQGVPNLKQIVSFSTQAGGGIVCERSPGVNPRTMPREAVDQIPVEHFRGLMQACVELEARGLWAAGSDETDMVYDPTAGFTINDIQAGPGPADSAATMAHGFGYWRQSIVTPFELEYEQQPLPEGALRFHQAFSDVLGAEAGQILLANWQAFGFAVPRRLLDH